MQRIKPPLAALAAWAFFSSSGAGGSPAIERSALADFSPIRVAFTTHTLENGLQVILSEDHSAPTVSIAVTYKVGSRDERKGRTGFAHLFEHMMFQGSENVGKGEHFILVLNNGGRMNGTTNADRTNYFQTLPSNQLDLGLFLEADRMRSLDISQANLDNQRHAVQEERRQRVDNQPYGLVSETLIGTAYDNFAYQHSTIGSMEDLNAATLEDIADFFRIYYAPNNAVLTLVGAFDSKRALDRVRHHFGEIPRQPAPPEPDLTEPPQTAERRASLQDRFARLPRIDMAWKIPPGYSDDWYALSVLASILGSGQTSRLYQKLVRKEEAAIQSFSGAQARTGTGLLTVVAVARPGVPLERLEELIDAQIDRLQNEKVTPAELEKVFMQLRRQRAQSLNSTLSRAVQIGNFAVTHGNPELFNLTEKRIQKVTAEDIQRVARKYLVKTNRTVVTTAPERRAEPGRESN